MKKEVEEMKEERDVAKKNYTEECKKRKTIDSPVRQQVEQLLIDNGVDRGASHGGELTGVACLVLEDKIESLMAGLKQVMHAARPANVRAREVDQMVMSYEKHFLLLSHLFSLARTQKHVFKQAAEKERILNEMRKTIQLVDGSTKRLNLSMRTPKRHIASSHLVAMIDLHDGIAEWLEDWLEQVHQTQKRNDARGKIRQREVKARYTCRVEALARNAGIAMHKKTRHKFKEQTQRVATLVVRKTARVVRRKAAMMEMEAMIAAQPVLVDHRTGLPTIAEC